MKNLALLLESAQREENFTLAAEVSRKLFAGFCFDFVNKFHIHMLISHCMQACSLFWNKSTAQVFIVCLQYPLIGD